MRAIDEVSGNIHNNGRCHVPLVLDGIGDMLARHTVYIDVHPDLHHLIILRPNNRGSGLDGAYEDRRGRKTAGSELKRTTCTPLSGQ